MKLWNCFICGADSQCDHREPELMVWVKRLGDERLIALRIEPQLERREDDRRSKAV